MKTEALRTAASLALIGCLATGPAWAAPTQNAEARAAATAARMTPDEQVAMTHGIMPMPMFGKVPSDAVIGSGYVAGVPRLGVPALRETDASLGVAYLMNLRNDGGATPLPAGLATASTWDPALARLGGATIGRETKAKGFNVMLAGGANLMRDPRNGRTFEYLSEDPLLTGVLAGDDASRRCGVNTLKQLRRRRRAPCCRS